MSYTTQLSGSTFHSGELYNTTEWWYFHSCELNNITEWWYFHSRELYNTTELTHELSDVCVLYLKIPNLLIQTIECCRKTPLPHVKNTGIIRCPTLSRIAVATSEKRCAKSCVSRPILSHDIIKTDHAQSAPMVKVRRGVGGPITTDWNTPGHLPCNCRASPGLGYRPPKTRVAIIFGEDRLPEIP